MKTYSERLAEVTGKMRQIRRRRAQKRMSWAIAAAAVLTLVLFFPLNVEPPNVRAYSDSPYYELIKRIDKANGGEPGYKNLFSAIKLELTGTRDEKPDEDVSVETPTMPPEAELPEGSGGDQYADLQPAKDTISGVTDGDVLLYTDDYIFRLSYNLLKVYSRNGDQSKKIAEHRINAKMLCVDGKYERYENFSHDTQMFLSEDGTEIIVVISVRLEQDVFQEHMPLQYFTLLIQLDVSDPKNIQETDRLYLSGEPKDVRLVDGELLVAAEYEVGIVSDYQAVFTYVPLTGRAGELTPIPAEDILLADEIKYLWYTMLYKVDTDTLKVNDQLAVTNETRRISVYLTEEYLFTCGTKYYAADADNFYSYTMEEEITLFRYRDELTLVNKTILPEGRSFSHLQKDKLWMITAQTSGDYPEIYSLYCLQVPELEVISVTENITPRGWPRNVRYQDDRLTLTHDALSNADMTLVFDLSDPKKVTFWQGEATTLKEKLVKWTDDYWLGIRMADEGYSMTLELFTETDSGFRSVGKYEMAAKYASGADSLFIDPEQGLLGMYVRVETHSNQWTSHWRDEYVLLKFTNGQWEELAREIGGNYQVLPLDGWLYLVYNDIQTIPLP